MGRSGDDLQDRQQVLERAQTRQRWRDERDLVLAVCRSCSTIEEAALQLGIQPGSVKRKLQRWGERSTLYRLTGWTPPREPSTAVRRPPGGRWLPAPSGAELDAWRAARARRAVILADRRPA